MDSQASSPSVSRADPGMCGCDRDVFLRVWSRVMPAERPDSPILVERPEEEKPVPAASAQPTPPTEGAGDDFPTPDDVPCLGSAAQADLERLREFTLQELARWRAYQALARRVPGQGARALAALAGGSRRRAKRLSAALFLISGVRFWPAEHGMGVSPQSYFGALREHFLAEQNGSCAYRAAAEDCRDMCLKALYLDLADHCADHACRIRTLLEQI